MAPASDIMEETLCLLASLADRTNFVQAARYSSSIVRLYDSFARTGTIGGRSQMARLSEKPMRNSRYRSMANTSFVFFTLTSTIPATLEHLFRWC